MAEGANSTLKRPIIVVVVVNATPTTSSSSSTATARRFSACSRAAAAAAGHPPLRRRKKLMGCRVTTVAAAAAAPSLRGKLASGGLVLGDSPLSLFALKGLLLLQQAAHSLFVLGLLPQPLSSTCLAIGFNLLFCVCSQLLSSFQGSFLVVLFLTKFAPFLRSRLFLLPKIFTHLPVFNELLRSSGSSSLSFVTWAISLKLGNNFCRISKEVCATTDAELSTTKRASAFVF
jgi:hypothetical protein